MNAVDTNVLFYARDARDPAKQAIAVRLLQSLDHAALLWQVACEYLAASRKLEPFGYSFADARHDIRDLRRVWTTILPSWTVLDRAEALLEKFSLSYWDAMILAACIEGGITRFYSEDFDAYRAVEGIEVVNPFSVS